MAIGNGIFDPACCYTWIFTTKSTGGAAYINQGCFQEGATVEAEGPHGVSRQLRQTHGIFRLSHFFAIYNPSVTLLSPFHPQFLYFSFFLGNKTTETPNFYCSSTTGGGNMGKLSGLVIIALVLVMVGHSIAQAPAKSPVPSPATATHPTTASAPPSTGSPHSDASIIAVQKMAIFGAILLGGAAFLV